MEVVEGELSDRCWRVCRVWRRCFKKIVKYFFGQASGL